MFTKEQVVVAVVVRGYEHFLTEGKEYKVLEYTPKQYVPDSGGFSWPAYLTVLDDNGRETSCHASRFKLKA